MKRHDPSSYVGKPCSGYTGTALPEADCACVKLELGADSPAGAPMLGCSSCRGTGVVRVVQVCPGKNHAEGGCRWWVRIEGEDETTGERLTAEGCYPCVVTPLEVELTARQASLAARDADLARSASEKAHLAVVELTASWIAVLEATSLGMRLSEAKRRVQPLEEQERLATEASTRRLQAETVECRPAKRSGFDGPDLEAKAVVEARAVLASGDPELPVTGGDDLQQTDALPEGALVDADEGVQGDDLGVGGGRQEEQGDD